MSSIPTLLDRFKRRTGFYLARQVFNLLDEKYHDISFFAKIKQTQGKVLSRFTFSLVDEPESLEFKSHMVKLAVEGVDIYMYEIMQRLIELRANPAGDNELEQESDYYTNDRLNNDDNAYAPNAADVERRWTFLSQQETQSPYFWAVNDDCISEKLITNPPEQNLDPVDAGVFELIKKLVKLAMHDILVASFWINTMPNMSPPVLSKDYIEDADITNQTILSNATDANILSLMAMKLRMIQNNYSSDLGTSAAGVMSLSGDENIVMATRISFSNVNVPIPAKVSETMSAASIWLYFLDKMDLTHQAEQLQALLIISDDAHLSRDRKSRKKVYDENDLSHIFSLLSTSKSHRIVIRNMIEVVEPPQESVPVLPSDVGEENPDMFEMIGISEALENDEELFDKVKKYLAGHNTKRPINWKYFARLITNNNLTIPSGQNEHFEKCMDLGDTGTTWQTFLEWEAHMNEALGL